MASPHNYRLRLCRFLTCSFSVILPENSWKYIQYSCVVFVQSDEKISARLNDDNYAVKPYIKYIILENNLQYFYEKIKEIVEIFSRI